LIICSLGREAVLPAAQTAAAKFFSTTHLSESSAWRVTNICRFMPTNCADARRLALHIEQQVLGFAAKRRPAIGAMYCGHGADMAKVCQPTPQPEPACEF
jgi:hypothetical protein